MTITKEIYRPLIPIDDAVSIEGLGFGKGSEVGVIINPTRQWRREWYNHFDLAARPREVPAAEDTAEDQTRREDAMLSRQYELAASVVISAKIYDRAGKLVYDNSNLDAADIRNIDEDIDPRILELVIMELLERGNGGVVNTRTTFRNEREGSTRGREKDKDKAAV
jgi:hypothetical protein